jgi:hypothetical protein
MRNPSTLRGRVRPRLFIGLSTALAISATIVLSAAFSGAIYTSLGDGTVVNQNLYASKPLVYLNGGPQNDNGPACRAAFTTSRSRTPAVRICCRRTTRCAASCR